MLLPTGDPHAATLPPVSDDADTAGCFLRVDVALPGEHTPEAYDVLGERLQDLLQEAVLQPADGGPEVDLRGMTCLVLGPLTAQDTMEHGHEEHFAPVVEWSSSDPQQPDLSAEDLRVLRQALNEVLSGPDAVEEWEFATRLGTSRDRARALLHRLAAHR